MTERDQASRVYKAEFQSGIRQHPDLSLGECQQYINKVVASKYVRENYRSSIFRDIFVTDGRGRRTGAASWGFHKGSMKPVVKLPIRFRNEYVILHELAHHFAGLSQGHKSAFTTVLLGLVKEFLGEEQHHKLLTEFAKNGVKIIKGNGEIGQATAPKSFQEIA
jgi:putative metallohydrolase (TIGR04338 family)